MQDYCYNKDGYYFVTLCSANRELFKAEEKKSINAYLINISPGVSGVRIDYFVVMDDHVHLILILENSSLNLGEIVRRFKARVTKDVGHPLWQANYYEHIIRNDKALDRIREYIQSNPCKERISFEEFYN